jgi:hypothetical protein
MSVFTRDPEAWFDEVVRPADIGADILADSGAVISAKPFRAGAYNEPLPLMKAIRCEGLDLWARLKAISPRGVVIGFACLGGRIDGRSSTRCLHGRISCSPGIHRLEHS